MELDLPSHRREMMLFIGIRVGFQDERGRRRSLQNRDNPIPQIKDGGGGEFFLATSRDLPRSGLHVAGAGSGMLSNGLAAEEVEGECAEECWDAVLAKQVELDELPDGSGELVFQKLHLSTRGAGGLRAKKNKPINTAGF